MCGMRAGMRCAQLREGAGGSGSPATGPSGWRLGRGGRGRGLPGGAGRGGAWEGRRARGRRRGFADSNFDLSFWIRPQARPAHKLSL